MNGPDGLTCPFEVLQQHEQANLLQLRSKSIQQQKGVRSIGHQHDIHRSPLDWETFRSSPHLHGILVPRDHACHCDTPRTGICAQSLYAVRDEDEGSRRFFVHAKLFATKQTERDTVVNGFYNAVLSLDSQCGLFARVLYCIPVLQINVDPSFRRGEQFDEKGHGFGRKMMKGMQTAGPGVQGVDTVTNVVLVLVTC